MNLLYPEPPSEEVKQSIRERGGICHRAPWTSVFPAQGRSLTGQPDLMVLSGFGLCQKDLCPLWDAATGGCLERINARIQAGFEERLPGRGIIE